MSKIYDSCIIDIYTDSDKSSEQIIPFIKSFFANKCIGINEYCGNKELHTDVDHFFKMFDYDNYILCNSTYHYWGAILSIYNKDKIVLYPEECSWFKNIADIEWIAL